ncbi:hypothetical protein PQE75_gp136 [Bacillus phage vB_BcoS-136]|uniref:Uncharacterized protein n=1 Tax=Bacillus phage vB_BcoS-136 TaxID=2419619 RepID=A0A3G3BVS6_9CAUD|nr:hypothetical protein PQE75_gp136 [Bacillus phage vB_BcoS-136]AYP68343.1 hypothetical protein vBBcoS136_00229 [Bacillus phage vB_BcoS-136]
MDNLRKVEVRRDKEWVGIHFSELKKGDNFRMFEPTGEEVVDKKGNTIFYAESEVYKTDDGVWCIEVLL